MTERRGYGSWESPISADVVAAGDVWASQVQPDGDDTYWLERRPSEGGRYVVVRERDGGRADITPAGFNVRTKVHEYGGGAFLFHDGAIFFANFDDQRVYRQDEGTDPVPITPQPGAPGTVRYADFRISADGRLMVAVRETHQDEVVTNDLAAVSPDGSWEPWSLSAVHDFYSNPRFDPSGRRLAWLAWDHPRMPWDGTELWVADISPEGELSNERFVVGGVAESIFQPEWSPEGTLHFVSDRTGWWNLYRVEPGDRIEALASMEAEFGEPQWWFGIARYDFLPDGRIVCAVGSDGTDRLTMLSPDRSATRHPDLPFTTYGWVRTAGSRITFVAGAPTEPHQVVSMDADTGETRTLHRSLTVPIDAMYVSSPRPIDFPTGGGLTAHGLFYAPANPEFEAPDDELPPLVVMSHGGPTGQAETALDPEIQFWTSRGFAVVDVNYGGSSGYGRDYRDRLKGTWGVLDVEDCVNAARHLVGLGEVDGARTAIRGGSAGGYTTLCALTFYDVFAAGASHYGISDLEAMARDTHKFESRYLDGLIGPYPEAADVYRERSPIHFSDRISAPVILLQGTEDEVVPPSQAEQMAGALAANGVPHAVLLFEGEQHGFRRAESIRRALEAELSFYGRVFGFEPADDLEPLQIVGM